MILQTSNPIVDVKKIEPDGSIFIWTATNFLDMRQSRFEVYVYLEY